MKQKIFQLLKDIKPAETAHAKGLKQVFITGDDTSANITQFAFGKMMPGDATGWHQHTTMEEYFYFIEGNGNFGIDGDSFKIEKGCFIRVPAATMHNLTAESLLTFTYFGISV